MGILKNLFLGNNSETRNIREQIERLGRRVENLEEMERYLHRHIEDRLDSIENNFTDQIAEKCYVKVFNEENLMYLLKDIRKHKKK